MDGADSGDRPTVELFVKVRMFDTVDLLTGCTDTSDPGHFGPKTVRHYVFGTEMSYFFLPVPKCLWDTSHQCRTVSTFFEGAEVSN